jgi:hypothetical protein
MRRQHDTLMFHHRNAHIPPVHALSWGKNVNQSTVKTPRIPLTLTAIRPTLLASSIPRTEAHVSTEKLNAPFQIGTTSTTSAEPRETRSSASSNENSINTARNRPRILITATGNRMPTNLRNGLGIVPSLTLSFPITVVRIWRIDR